MGPTSHPAPAHVNVTSPREMKGSSGNCETRASMFAELTSAAPDTNPIAEVVIEDPNW